MKKLLLPLLLFATLPSFCQNKKPIDHTVYDGWKGLGERMISNDGRYIIYTINPQEGDGELVIENIESKYKRSIARGYSASITNDSKYAVFKIKPFFQDTRQARIKKKKPDEMPKDSLAIIELGTDEVKKFGRIKSYKTPEKAGGWIAWQMEKALPDTSKKKSLSPDSIKVKMDQLMKLADSVIRISIDSVKGNIEKKRSDSCCAKGCQTNTEKC